MFWGVQLFSGKHTANVVPGSSLDRFTVQYHFAKWFQLFQKVLQQKNNQNQQDTGQIQKYSKQWDKNDRSFPCFATKWRFIVYVKHILYFSRSLSPLQTQFKHMKTYALMLLSLLWRLCQ